MQHENTVVHITQEALGPNGDLPYQLDGLITSGNYRSAIGRSIFIGPYSYSPTSQHNYPDKAGNHILYSVWQGLVDHPLAAQFAVVEQKFGVSIIYGLRDLYSASQDNDATSPSPCQVEFVLIDTANANIHPVNALKGWLYDEFDIESDRFEQSPQFNNYIKFAPAALAALRALEVSSPHKPAVLIAHDCMAIPTALAAVLDPLGAFKTIFWAHEVQTIRNIVEYHPGHDTMFYNIMRWAQKNNFYLPEIFGSQDCYFEHSLLTAVRYCDNIIATSERVRGELRFLSPYLDSVNIDLVYNGLGTSNITFEQKHIAKNHIQKYVGELLGFCPDYIFTQFGRLTTCKAPWRNLPVLGHLEDQFRKDNRRAVMFIVNTDRPLGHITNSDKHENPWYHNMGHYNPLDFSLSEIAIFNHLRDFNNKQSNIKIIYINQFDGHFYADGHQIDNQMICEDLPIASDVEFCQSIYEPFSLSQLRTLPFGGLCVINDTCPSLLTANIDAKPLGNNPSQRSIEQLTENINNLIFADYTQLFDTNFDRASLLKLDQSGRDRIEKYVSSQIAQALCQRLPQNDTQGQWLLTQGANITSQLSWEVVCQNLFRPALAYAYHHRRRRIA